MNSLGKLQIQIKKHQNGFTHLKVTNIKNAVELRTFSFFDVVLKLGYPTTLVLDSLTGFITPIGTQK